MIGIGLVYLIVVLGFAFGDFGDQKLRDGLAFPFLVGASIAGLLDLARQNEPSRLGAISAFLGLTGTFIVGFAATSKAFESDSGLFLGLVVGYAGLAVIVAIAAYTFLGRRKEERLVQTSPGPVSAAGDTAEPGDGQQ